MELIQQLNEVVKDKDGIERPKLHRVIKNLITQATTAADEYDEDGNLVKEGAGDLAAIREIFDRLEGKPRQQTTCPKNGYVRQYTKQAVDMFVAAMRDEKMDILLSSVST
jgi:hypothetical protein